MHRALRPGAVLGLIWNVEDYNAPRDWAATTAWEAGLKALVWGLPDDGHPRFRHGAWREVFERQVARATNPVALIRDSLTDNLPRFSLPLGEDRVQWTAWLAPEALWSRVNTLSQVALLRGEEREAARRRFDELVGAADVERNEKGEVAFHGVTYFAWTDRI